MVEILDEALVYLRISELKNIIIKLNNELEMDENDLEETENILFLIKESEETLVRYKNISIQFLNRRLNE